MVCWYTMNKDEQWLLGEKYDGELCPAYYEDLAQLRAGVPVAYLIGWVPFLGCKIWLDSRPLIPRPETEWWTEKAIEAIKQSLPPDPQTSDHRYVLDLCAGSGAIGVAVAKHLPEIHITFAEIDPAHLPTIEKNARENLSVNRTVLCDDIRLVRSDVFNNITKRFDFILCNPPYIDPALDRADVSVKTYEPHLALYGGVNGLELIAKIISKAPAHLNPQGQLWLEHEPEQADAIDSLGHVAGFTVSTHPDQYGVLRYSTLVLQ